MAKSSFKRVHDLEKRKAEAGRIQEKYTDRVPIDSIRGAPCRTPEEQYEEYLVEFNKAYSQEEKVLRMEYFKKSLQRINEWNQRPGETAIFGLTEFSDWSPEEWSGFTTVPNNLLPEEFYASAEADHAIQDLTSSPESKSSVIHAMTLVGASREHGRKYWLFKNSWGRDWGEQGFLKLVRGVKACRIGQFLHHPGKMRDTVNRISRSKRGNKGVRAEATIDSANVGCCGLFCSIC